MPGLVEADVQLDGALRAPERRPRKGRQTQVDGRRIHRIQPVLGPEAVPRGPLLTTSQQPSKERLVKRVRLLGVDPRQRRAADEAPAEPAGARVARVPDPWCSASTNVAGRVASFEDVTRHPQNDRTRCLGRIASRRHRRAEIRPPGGSAWTGSRRGAWRAPVPSPAVRRVSSRESSSTAGVPPFNAGLKATTAIEAAERAVCHPWMRHSRRSVTSRCATNCTRSPARHLPGPSRGRTGVRGVLRSVT